MRRNDPEWNAQDAAERVLEAILQGRDEPYLRWRPDGQVRVVAKRLIPTGPKQTVEGRSKRFTAALKERMESAGWRKSGVYWAKSTGPD